jgi:hypothetical protein
MMNKLILTAIAVLIYAAGFSQSLDRPQESSEDPSSALTQIADRYVEEIITARPFLAYVYASLSEFFEPDHSAWPDRSPAALKTFEKIEDETLSFTTTPAQGTATNQELTTSAETLEEYLTGLYSELMDAYILHHNTDLYAKHTTEDYFLVVEIGLIQDRELVLITVENIDFRSVIIENEEFLHHGDTVVLIGNKEMKGSIMGYTIDAKIRYMTVFVQEEGRWKMMSGSFSPVVHPSVLYGEPEEG